MEHIFRFSKMRRKYATFATVRGQPIPVPAVREESWRAHFGQPSMLKKYGIVPGKEYQGWSDRQVTSYLESVCDPKHGCWDKF